MLATPFSFWKSSISAAAAAQIHRIIADGGTIDSEPWLDSFIADLQTGSGGSGDCYALVDAIWVPGCSKRDGSNKVSRLYDIGPQKLGFGTGGYYDATQSGGSVQGSYVPNVLDSLPVLRGTLGSYDTGTIQTRSQPSTVFAVAKRDGGSSVIVDTSVGRMMLTYAGNTLIRTYADTFLDATTTETTWAQWTALFNGASSNIRRNRASIVTGNAGGSVSSGVYHICGIGGLFALTGDLAALISVRQAITPAQRNHIESVVNNRWPSTV